MPYEVQWSTPTDEDVQAVHQARPDLFAASDNGELLKFSNAVLCRAERNKNGDMLDEAGLAQIASTLPLMPLDDEHDEQMVIGLFTAAKVKNSAVLCDGIVYARRFPEQAEDIRAGRKKLSVEAFANRAECSVCSKVFTPEDKYCEHLQKRRANGATRKLSDLMAVGGGATIIPAGTDTTFDTRNGFRMIASLGPDEELSTPVEPVEAELAPQAEQASADVAAALCDPKEDNMELDELKATLAQVQARLQEVETNLEARTAELAGAQAQVATLTASVDAANLVTVRVIDLLALGMAREQVEAIQGDLGPQMTASVFGLLKDTQGKLIASRQTPDPAPEPKTNVTAGRVMGDVTPESLDVTGWSTIFKLN